jgi:outer membrane protein assembly factor BamD (BamD/ComL family)
MIKKLTGFFLIVLLAFTACSGGRDKKIAEIKDLENRLLKDSTSAKDEVAAYNLQVAYTDFSEKYPQDAEAPEYLFKAANLSIGLGWGESAINILTKFIDTYPQHARTPEALFYKAFVYDNQLNDDVKAGEAYRLYLEKYPKHEYASSAEASIKNLGKSDEDLVREFEAKLNADTTQSASVNAK